MTRQQLTRKLRITRNEDYDYIGLEPLWMPGHQADALQGMGVAHDVLEHGTADVCEWQGLGGAVFVRGLTGYFSARRIGNPDPVVNIASDFIQLFHLWEYADIPSPRMRPKRSKASAIAADMIEEIVREGARMLLQEMEYSDAEQMQHAKTWTRPAQCERMRDWMLLGYRACAHRWRLVDAWDVAETFSAIERETDTFLERHAEYLGADVVLSFDVLASSARLDMVEEDYDDGDSDN